MYGDSFRANYVGGCMINVLLVEDDAAIVKVIKDYFERREDFAIETAENGLIGEELFYERTYDLVLLDIMMPKKDGFELCRDLRKRSSVPIIFITAREKTEDALLGYELGCDDYIVKPFSLETLYAKCLALVRRDKGFVSSSFVSAGPIKLNPITFEVMVDDSPVDLPLKEFMILKLLIDGKGSVVSREMLLTKIWGYDYEGSDRVLDNRIKNLRKLLGKGSKSIKTVFGKGFRIEM